MTTDFVFHLRAKGLSADTIAAYSFDVGRYLGWCETQRTVPAEAAVPTARRYLKHLLAQMTRPAVARKVVALRVYYRFLILEELAKENPFEGMGIGLGSRRLPRALSHEEVTDLLSRARGTCDETTRDRTILEVLYETGLRVSEVRSLREDSVDLDGNTIRVIGKREKERVVVLGEGAKHWIRRYLRVREDWAKRRGEAGEALFVSQRHGTALTRQTIHRIVRKYAREAGIRKPVGPHTLRHSCATELLRGGMNLRYVQMQLGHDSPVTTQRYTHLNVADLEIMQLKYHPRG
jgi:integrase/recombinase XerD